MVVSCRQGKGQREYMESIVVDADYSEDELSHIDLRVSGGGDGEGREVVLTTHEPPPSQDTRARETHLPNMTW